MGGISIWQLLIIAVIVILLFGTKKLRGIGSDLGDAVKGFKKAMKDEDKEEKEPPEIEKKADENFQAKQKDATKEKEKEKDHS